jgi:pimeloyl-ACP methyl ester carboxylesterase
LEKVLLELTAKLHFMRTEISPGISLSYQLTGTGQTIVFLHPFPMDHRLWESQIEHFAPHNQVLTPDLRGFGNSEGFGAQMPFIEQMADDLNALLDVLKITERIVLCGLSIGGYVALRFAQKYFSRLRGLVICDSRAQADTDETKAGRDRMIAFAKEHTSGEIVGKVLSGLLGKTSLRTRPELIERVKEIGSSQSQQAILDALAALRDRPDATAWLKKITIPTLLIFGEEDALAPSHVIETLLAGLPQSTLVKLPKAGHFSALEQPEMFNSALEEYLNGL